MEYIIGTITRNGIAFKNLKIISDTHTDLKGFQQLIHEYPDPIITDNFRVVEKYHEAEDASGNTYDWYIIDHHYRTVDRTKAFVKEQERQRADIDFIMIMEDLL